MISFLYVGWIIVSLYWLIVNDFHIEMQSMKEEIDKYNIFTNFCKVDTWIEEIFLNPKQTCDMYVWYITMYRLTVANSVINPVLFLEDMYLAYKYFNIKTEKLKESEFLA
jgi:hypothetical protein